MYRISRLLSQTTCAALSGRNAQVVREELQRLCWTESILGQEPKGDVEKVKIAVRLRRETVVTVAWIAERLEMGSVAHVNTRLHQWRRGRPQK